MDNVLKDDLLKDSKSSNTLGIMKRYPFNGSSKYLIDKFYIIGYDSPTLNKILIKQDLDFMKKSSISTDNIPFEKNSDIFPQEFKITEPPFIINEISSDYSKEVLDIDMIIEMIFPNKPSFYYVEEDFDQTEQLQFLKSSTTQFISLKEKWKSPEKTRSINKGDILSINNDDIFFNTCPNNKYNESESKKDIKEKWPCSYNVVFSSNPQLGGNDKKSINGFAHVFYKKFKDTKKYENKIYSFYVPIVFCIISEYTYYNSFFNLMLQIMLLFKRQIIELPIEIHIQNIVNFALSPLNDDVILNIETLSFIKLRQTESSKISYVEEEEEEKEKEKDIGKKVQK